MATAHRVTKSAPAARDVQPAGHGIDLIPVAEIARNPRNPRTHFDPDALSELAESLVRGELLQPVGVRRATKKSKTAFILIWGERRWRAAQQADLREIPARVCDVTSADALLMVGDENIHRHDWNAVEKARYILDLGLPIAQGGAGLSDQAIAERFAKSHSWVCNLKRLLSLPEDWQARVASGELSERQARALCPYADQPVVLAAIAADWDKSPWAWRSAEDIERNARLLAEESNGRAPRRNSPRLNVGRSDKLRARAAIVSAVASRAVTQADEPGDRTAAADVAAGPSNVASIPLADVTADGPARDPARRDAAIGAAEIAGGPARDPAGVPRKALRFLELLKPYRSNRSALVSIRQLAEALIAELDAQAHNDRAPAA